MAQEQCERYCVSDKICLGCSLHCNETCRWKAYKSTDKTCEKPLNVEMSVKPSKIYYSGNSCNFSILILLKE